MNSRTWYEAQLSPDAPDLPALAGPLLHDQLITGRGILPGTVRIELHLSAAWASPAGQTGHVDRHAGMFDRERLAFEATGIEIAAARAASNDHH